MLDKGLKEGKGLKRVRGRGQGDMRMSMTSGWPLGMALFTVLHVG